MTNVRAAILNVWRILGLVRCWKQSMQDCEDYHHFADALSLPRGCSCLDAKEPKKSRL